MTIDNFNLDYYFENNAKDVLWALPVDLVTKDLNEFFFEAKEAPLGGNGLEEMAGEPVAL